VFWIVYSLIFVGLLYVSLRNFPKHRAMSVAVTACMMLAFSPVFTRYDVYQPLVLGFPLWFLAWFLIAAVFVWIILFYVVNKLLPNNQELEEIWERMAREEEKME